MKKLNRKGFTLVELLAVIVILAIVVGISIPSVTSIINGSKNSALGVAVEAAADHLQDQFDMYILDQSSVGGATGLIGRLITKGNDADPANRTLTITDASDLEELGFKTDNVTKVEATVIHDVTTNKAKICVNVREIKASGDYYTTNHWNTDGTIKTVTNAGVTEDVDGVKNKAGNGC